MRSRAAEVAPASRLLRHGARVLSDVELIGVLLSGADAKGGAPGLARDLLRDRGGLAGLVATTPAQLRVSGLEDAHASNLLAACELACRLAAGNVPERKLLTRPNDVVRYLHLRYGRDDQEVMGALYVNRRHGLVGEAELFRGTLDRAAVEPRQILKGAFLHAAAGVLLFHTHPSGDPSPSKEDILFHRRMAAACDVVGVCLLDHWVLGAPNRWDSLRLESEKWPACLA
jgi:DNA repair protein RadC